MGGRLWKEENWSSAYRDDFERKCTWTFRTNGFFTTIILDAVMSLIGRLKWLPGDWLIVSNMRNALLLATVYVVQCVGSTRAHLMSMLRIHTLIFHDLALSPISPTSNLYPSLDWFSEKFIVKRPLNFMFNKSRDKMIPLSWFFCRSLSIWRPFYVSHPNW